MSGYLFPASASSTTSSCTPWTLPGWQVASFLLFATALSPPPFPYASSPSIVSCCLLACFPDSLVPVPSGENSPWGLLISIVFPGCHSWHRFCWVVRIWGLFVVLSLNPLTERSSHVARQERGWSDPGWQRQAYHHSDPDISRRRPGGGSAMGMPGCTSAHIKRNVILLQTERQVTLTKDPWIFWALPFSRVPQVSLLSLLLRQKEGERGLSIWPA